MNREDAREDLIDLGVVSTDTKGAHVGINDFENGLQLQAGLADD